jgi:serine/threonine protein kinase
VKVLDFGLAKAFAGEKDDVNLSNSPTLSDAATQQGVILGTVAYMPPEQAKGKIVDKRADIWAFGVVLFEMLTGRQLFTGETVSETLAAVLMREPDFKAEIPRLLFEGFYVSRLPANDRMPAYSVSADGQRFLMFKGKENPQNNAVTQINLIQNWFEELKQRVPVK